MIASYTVRRELSVPVERAFDVVVAEDVLPAVLHRWGPIPGVVGTTDLTGPWDTPGSERTVLLSDGRSARETVLAWERPSRFAYRVEEIEGSLGRLVNHAIGEWWFEATGSGSHLRWTYTFSPTRGGLLVALFTRTAWAAYMRQCATLCVERAEAR